MFTETKNCQYGVKHKNSERQIYHLRIASKVLVFVVKVANAKTTDDKQYHIDPIFDKF